MGILAIAELATITSLASCYSPQLVDCTVSCSALADCAEGQVCGDDHLCTTPERRCRDGGAPVVDAIPLATLQLQIAGNGRITVPGLATCDAAAPQNGSCSVLVPVGAALQLGAEPYADWRFEQWTATCTTSAPTCELAVTSSTLVAAKFHKEDH